jgi:hypothetical protein
MAKADVFDNNGITVRRKFATILEILDKIGDPQTQGVI